MKTNIIQEKSFSFAVKAIKIYKLLQENREFILSKQFLRSATSIGANVEEALAAISRKDFAAKMSISSKEARETLYWLRILEAGEFMNYDYSSLKSEADKLIRILSAIVKTSQQKIQYS